MKRAHILFDPKASETLLEFFSKILASVVLRQPDKFNRTNHEGNLSEQELLT